MTEGNTWNQQLKEWYISQGKATVRSKIVRNSGIPLNSFSDYTTGKTKSLRKISPERVKQLYELTRLECFNQYPDKKDNDQQTFQLATQEEDNQYSNDIKDVLKTLRKGLTDLVQNATDKLNISNNEKLRLGLTKSQQYTPTAEERTDGIMQLLDLLAEEVDYFRTSSPEEKTVLTNRLNIDPESFGYITQMLNIIYDGKKLDSWMLMAQPPSKLKRIK